MLDIKDYIKLAKQQQAIKSNEVLSLRLDQSKAAVGHWCSGRNLPRDDKTMRRLAELGGLNVEQALADLGRYRAVKAGDQATASIYKSMSKMIEATRHAAAMVCLVVLLSLSSYDNGSYAGTLEEHTAPADTENINYTQNVTPYTLKSLNLNIS